MVDMKTKICPHCKKEKYLSEFGKRPDKPSMPVSWCKSCCAERANKDYHSVASPSYTKESRARAGKKYREKHKEQIRQAALKRRLDDPQKERDRLREVRKRLRDEMLKAYGGKCSCCGENHREFLTLEHKNGGGRKHRKETHGGDTHIRRLRDQGWPKEGYTILCWNCNSAKGMYGYCPHQRKEGVLLPTP